MRDVTGWGAVRVAAAAAVAVAVACGGGGGGGGNPYAGGGTTSGTPSGTPSGTTAFTISIKNLAFDPVRLEVPPGATVTVRNLDAMPHSVTSESAPNAFRPGAAGGISFDTGLFSNGERTFTIPANAKAGDTVPFFCTAHLGTMATPNGEIVIGATSGATSPSTPSTTQPAGQPSAPAMPPGY